MPLGFTRHSNRSQQLAPLPQVLPQQQQLQLPPQLSQADQPQQQQQQAHLQQQQLLPQQQLQQQQQQHVPQQPPTALASAPENKGYDQGVVAQPQPQQIQQQQQQQPYPNPADDVASYQAPPADQQSGGNAYHELTAHPSAAPTRSRSHRFSTSYLHINSPPPPQQQQQQGPPQNSAETAPFAGPSDAAANAKVPAPGELKKSSTAGPAAPVLSPEPHKKSKSRNFFGQFSSKSHRESSSSSSSRQQQQQQQQAPPAATLKSPAVGRRISKKNNDSLPEPPQQQQNNSVERLQQQTGWQSNQSSGTLPSPQEQQQDDGLDPYLIRDKEAEHQASAYDPRLGLTVRVVAEGQVAPQQYHQFQEQVVHSPQQYSPQQYQLASQQHNAQIAEDPSLDYTNQAPQQPGQYQQQHAQQQSLGSFVSTQQYRNPEVVSQLSHDSPLDPDDLQRPPSVQSSQGYTTQQQQYPSRTASATQDPPRLTHQSSSNIMAPPAPQGSQSRKSTDKSLQQQGDNRAPPPGYTQGSQFPPPNQSTPTTAQSPLPPIPNPQQQQQPPTNYRNSQLRGEYGPDGRSTPPLQETRELTEMDKLRKSLPSPPTSPRHSNMVP